MKNPASLAFLLALLAAAALAGCSGGGSSSGTESSAAPPAAAPAADAAVTLPAGLDEGPRAGESPVDESKAAAGEKLFQTKGCSACHAFGKKVTGPDLAGVTKRRTAKWIESQILHPEVMTKQDPISKDLLGKFMLQMPNQKLTPDEAAAVIEYFKSKDR